MEHVINGPLDQYSLPYERACVQFNCGAVASQIALLQNRSSDDGLKVACKYFQIAAGTFKALREDLQNQNAQTRGTSDLTEDVLFMLENVMLAQAQECFFDKVCGARGNWMREGTMLTTALGCQKRLGLCGGQSGSIGSGRLLRHRARTCRQ